jgi:hypothetical protein
MEIILDNLPIEVLEAYDTIEKLLSPDERIISKNKQTSDCLLLILNNLYFKNCENGKLVKRKQN